MMQLRSTGDPDTSNPVTMSVLEYLSSKGCEAMEDKQSNAQRIRSMTDEELAEIIVCPYDTDPSVCNYKGVCLDCCLEWLKQPVED